MFDPRANYYTLRKAERLVEEKRRKAGNRLESVTIVDHDYDNLCLKR